MSQDIHDIEWICSCGHLNPDFDKDCNGCGEMRYPIDNEEPLDSGPGLYAWLAQRMIDSQALKR